MPTTISTKDSQVVRAPRERVYAAFLSPEDLLAWLPPGDMTGEFHAFDARVGGGYRMSLHYASSEHAVAGKTAENEDAVTVRFTELTPPERIVEAIRFVSEDPAFAGEMTMTVTFAVVPGGTEVTMLFERLPPGLRPEDNSLGARQSLAQLARHLER